MTERFAIDITPDKSLIKKLGLTGYRTEQALAELVDNSIDARMSEHKETIKVKLDFEKREIEVIDNGVGMEKDEVRDAMTIARGTKSIERLGKFGIGLKSACSALGKEFAITTSKINSDKEYFIKYNENEWLSNETLGWKNFAIEEREKKENWHGTRITISNLNVPLYPNQVTNFKTSFGIRYAPYLIDGQIEIQINNTYCRPEQPEIEKGTRKELEITLPTGVKIKGWIALLTKRSIRGNYGIHLFKNGRLVKAYEKFGIRSHPEVAKIIGKLDLDHVPVNFQKSEFIVESSAYQEARDAFEKDPTVKQVVKQASQRSENIMTVERILQYMSGEASAAQLSPRISANTAKHIFDNTTNLEVRIGGKPALFTFVNEENSPLYTITEKEGKLNVRVNKSAEIFDYFKNPLFLVGMIAVESSLVAQNPEIYEQFLALRNAEWLRFVKDWGNQQTQSPYYYLTNELADLNNFLTKKFERKFQFTALSTLERFLNNALGRSIYTVYTEPGSGNYLTDLVTRYAKGDFLVLYNPSQHDLDIALNASEKKKVIVIREYAHIYGSSVAEPAEAWNSLLNEIHTYGIPVSENELYHVLRSLIRYDLVDRHRLMMLARRRKKEEIANRIISEVF